MDNVNPDFRKRLRQELPRIEHPGMRAFASALLHQPQKNRHNAQKTEIQLRADAIVEETAQVAATGSISPGYQDLLSRECKPVPQVSIPGPPEKYAWTKREPGYEAARVSAVKALHYLWASGQAAAAGHKSKRPTLEAFLFLIRTGRIQRSDPVVQEAIAYADKHGFLGNIRERIVQEFHNAEKRVPTEYCEFNISDSFFYDLNWFHVTLAALWVGGLFWLMPDRLIADFLLSKRAVPPTTRQAVSQAVLRMGLVKHKPPIVKSIGRDFELSFVEGFPPQS